MMKRRLIVIVIFLVVSGTTAFCQINVERKHSIGSSLYILGNLNYKEPVYDLHLNYGYQATQKDFLIIEVMT
ncbi:MAG: hypothetical protein MUP82_01360 [Candidatus Marinimicrobia bacterium]|nr:hypothetical protein [Candidatus Neomarinimicrobiota bacterium]